ncbi:MAG TPA: helix-turn-helix domain-containing protein [Acidimicrobiales bacterium]|jgi:AcrR family transcriptional regulator
MTQAPAEGSGLLDAESDAEPDENEPQEVSTRERILDIALELFTDKGFDRTSLREIAERLSVTKAALYYHFASKDDILMALHMRLHELGKGAVRRMTEEPISLELWRELLDEMVTQMLVQRKIFLMHERNQAALEKLHSKDHDEEHEDIQVKFREILADPRLPLRDRVRMACSFGAIFAGLFMSGDAFNDTSDQKMGDLLHDAVHDLLAP